MEAKRSFDWQSVMNAAHDLGVNPSATKKWRQRGVVPHRWRLPIIEKTNGAVTPEDFLRVPAPSILPEPCEAAE